MIVFFEKMKKVPFSVNRVTIRHKETIEKWQELVSKIEKKKERNQEDTFVHLPLTPEEKKDSNLVNVLGTLGAVLVSM